jgi:PilZ domain
MKTQELRAELRFPITQRGTLGGPGVSFPCLIQDFSSNGFLIMCTAMVQVGDILELKCELYPNRILDCKIEVRHINNDLLGTKIVEMSKEGAMLCRQFIDEHVSLKRFR